jgi:hypothetical protein
MSIDDTKEEELPEGYHVTDGADEVDEVDAIDPVEELEETNEDQFDKAFGKEDPLFPEGDEDAKEMFDIFAQQYDER